MAYLDDLPRILASHSSFRYTARMRVYLQTLGCRLNFAEMAALGRQLSAQGHELASDAATADVCVLNSCAVTGEAARQSRQLARQMSRANPASRLIVTGCYATLEGEAVGQLPNVALVVGNNRKEELLSLMHDLTPHEPPPATPIILHEPVAARTRAFIKVQDGCRNRCTFCIVTVARGEERSRSIDEIVTEVRALHAEGYQEAVLTGVHLGGYGADLYTGLRALVENLLAHTDIPRLRLSSLEPFDLEPDFFTLWRQSRGRLMPHLHLPAQSGSDAILKRMARRNRVAHFEALVAAARSEIAGLTVTTDLIAGFPGESTADFTASTAFARRVGFAHMHVFPYSARQGTAAAGFGGQVPEVERKRRARELMEVDAEVGAAVRRFFLGQSRPVLWEASLTPRELARLAPTLPAAPDDAVWSGLTDNYLRVLAVAPHGRDLHNAITPARLVRLVGADLWGEIEPVGLADDGCKQGESA